MLIGFASAELMFFEVSWLISNKIHLISKLNSVSLNALVFSLGPLLLTKVTYARMEIMALINN